MTALNWGDDQDEDGYPTTAALKRIAEWPATDLPGLVRYISYLWWMADWGIAESPDLPGMISVSTLGWAGNEAIIDALRKTKLWECLYSAREGGHYVFRIPQ